MTAITGTIVPDDGGEPIEPPPVIMPTIVKTELKTALDAAQPLRRALGVIASANGSLQR